MSGRPWQPGQSGNPNGRPRKGKTLSECLEKLVQKNSNRQELMQAIWALAIGHWVRETDKKGQERTYLTSPQLGAIAFIFERLEGRVPVKVDVEHRIRQLAEALGWDHDEAVRDAEAILAGSRESMT